MAIKRKDGIVVLSELPYERTLAERGIYPYSDANFLTGGIEKGTITTIAGDAGSGKTTFVSAVMSNLLADNDKVFAIFGEGTLKDQQIKIYRQMTPYKSKSELPKGEKGYDFVWYYKNKIKTNIGSYFVSKEDEEKVRENTAYKLFLYETKYGMKISQILENVDFAHQNYGCDYIIIDNASQIESETANETKELKDSIESLRAYAINNNVAFILLAHYRKQTDMTRIRRDMTEIMSTSAISQKSAVVMNIIRIDYLDRSTKQFKDFAQLLLLNGFDLEKKRDNGKYEISSIVEVLKSRHEGRVGFFALGFNSTTQTFYQIDKPKDSNTVLYNNNSNKNGDSISNDNPFK